MNKDVYKINFDLQMNSFAESQSHQSDQTRFSVCTVILGYRRQLAVQKLFQMKHLQYCFCKNEVIQCTVVLILSLGSFASNTYFYFDFFLPILVALHPMRRHTQRGPDGMIFCVVCSLHSAHGNL